MLADYSPQVVPARDTDLPAEEIKLVVLDVRGTEVASSQTSGSRNA